MATSHGRRPISPTSSAGSPDGRRRGHLYGRRKGPKLSAHQQGLRETLLPALLIVPQPGRDPRRYFSPPLLGQVADVWLEVGYGAGEHLLWQAEHRPQIGVIGAEPYESGTAKLLSKLSERPLPNIRLYEGDARDILAALPDASLGRVFILFPDPWPKSRHHKRRFVQAETLDALARVMRPAAELRFATDDAGYFAYALERLMAHPHFGWTAEAPADWTTRPGDWPPTRYEAKALHGPPAYLRFVRTGNIGP